MRVSIFPRFLVTSFTAALLSANLAADDRIADVQKALKEQEFFFGEVNGQRDEETRAAVRRFQIHSGLPVTGEIDAATIAAVESRSTTEPVAVEAEATPERSVRGQMRNLVRSDEEFLEEVEATDLTEETTTTEIEPPPAPVKPIAPPEPEAPVVTQIPPPPPPAPREPELERVPEPKREVTRETTVERVPEPKTEVTRETTVERSVERSAQVPPPPRMKEEERSRPPAPAGMTEREAESFVRGYLQAAEAPSPEGEISHYAERVDYFDSGRVNRRFIEKDQRNYYRRWPNRDFDLLEADLIKSTEKSATVRFRTKYNLGGNKDRASGRIENVVRLTRGSDGEWKIASIRERKLGN